MWLPLASGYFFGESEYSGTITTALLEELQSSRYGKSPAMVCAKNPPPVRCKITFRLEYPFRLAIGRWDADSWIVPSRKSSRSCRRWNRLSADDNAGNGSCDNTKQETAKIIHSVSLDPTITRSGITALQHHLRKIESTIFYLPPQISIRSAIAAPFNIRVASSDAFLTAPQLVLHWRKSHQTS